MKRIIILVSLLVAVNVNAQDIICKKSGRYYRPANELSKSIAESLNVKTCTGERFKKVVAQLGYTTNVKATKKRLSVDELVAKLKKSKQSKRATARLCHIGILMRLIKEFET